MPNDRATSRKRESFVPPPWRAFYEQTSIPAAIRAGQTLYVTGHAGEMEDGTFPEGADAQIRGTFRNIASTLAEAGASWDDVVEMTSYHVGLRSQISVLLAVAAEFLTEPYPAWTAAGVTDLFDEGAVVEISCVAIVP